MRSARLAEPNPEEIGGRLSGTVLRARSSFYSVETPRGVIECRLRGRMRKERQASDLAVIGDRVSLTPLPDGTGIIEGVEPRASKFSRRQPGPRGTWREDVLVANLDQVLIVFSCADPPPNPRLIDRFLVVAEQNEIDAVLIANKVELVGEAAAETIFGLYEDLSYPVIYTSAKTGQGVEEMRATLAGRISVITGPSGVGKSSLLNRLQPGLRIVTAEVSETLRKGRHTTTSAELHAVEGPRRGHVADTPGLRELGLFELPASELAWCFREMRPFLGSCAFNDCSHLHEPRCAVRAAVELGDVPPQRYESYRRLRTEEAR